MSRSIGASDTPVYQCRKRPSLPLANASVSTGLKEKCSPHPTHTVASQPWQAAGFVLQDLDQDLHSLPLLCHQSTNQLINQ